MTAPHQTRLPFSVHAAVIAINEAIDHGVPEGTLAAMHNPNAMLDKLDPSSAQQYHDTLYQAKGAKVATSRKRVSRFHPSAGDRTRRSANALHMFQMDRLELWPEAEFPGPTIKCRYN